MRGETRQIDGDSVLRHLRIAKAMMQADAAAWVQFTDGREECRWALGSDGYVQAASDGLGSLRDLGHLVEAQAKSQARWPGHPFVSQVPKGGTLVVQYVAMGPSQTAALCVGSRLSAVTEAERAAFADLAQLLTFATSHRERQALVVRERLQASIDVAKLFDDIGEQHWLYRQIIHQMPGQLLFVYDHALVLRLVDGTIAFPGTCGADTTLIGRSLNELEGDADKSLLIDICRKALTSEPATALLLSLGRHYDVRTAPLKDRSGNTVFGVGLVRDVTEDAERVATERLLSARLRTLVDSLDSGILVEDERHVIQHCNAHFCTLTQSSELPQNLLGRSSIELMEQISPAFFIPEALSERIDELKHEGKVVKDELVYLADMRILERCYSPLELDSKIVGHLWTYRDVTDRERNKDLLQRQADELRALSLVDELTGLYNRRGFLTLSTQQLKLCDRSMRPAMLVFVDLDGMKRINDELGHEYGDQALVETASVLRQCFRYSDVVARLGGDEFVVLAVEADPPQSEQVVVRLYEKLAELNAMPARKFELKFSIGIAPYDPSKLEMVEEVLARADSLMYEQKRLRKAERKD